MTEREMISFTDSLSPADARKAWADWYADRPNTLLVRMTEERNMRRRIGWNRRLKVFAGYPERECGWEYCSNRFKPTRSTRLYCSATCRQRARRQR